MVCVIFISSFCEYISSLPDKVNFYLVKNIAFTILVIRNSPPKKGMIVTKDCQMILFQPQGRLDLEGGTNLLQQMTTRVPQQDALWVVNLAKIDFMDSSGLVSLIKGLKESHACGCRLVLCNVQAHVRLVFELTQLDSVFEIFDTYENLLLNC